MDKRFKKIKKTFSKKKKVWPLNVQFLITSQMIMLSKTNSKYKTVSFTFFIFTALQLHAPVHNHRAPCRNTKNPSYFLVLYISHIDRNSFRARSAFDRHFSCIEPISFLLFFLFFFEDKNLSKQLQESHFFLSALNFKDPLFVVAIAAR